MERRALATLVLCATAWLSCTVLEPKPFGSDAAFQSYVADLGLSGVTAQAATARLDREGFQCAPSDKVIAGAPQEIVFLCRRAASQGSCSQIQSVVMQLDWVGTPRMELAPGMRIKSLGSVLDNKNCS
jgi:hypothetical protein